ncbi:YidC/Oxa1 family membrane protein insertase [Patescibacteria group bacterium]|nr:YidC/Oxa1 family membrane protein insertase [Patescibacteria group bacterium]MBU4162051.1 YidC/Oxa1 family membrane protein insertase [Patescibacteria group bacterium]
MNAFTNFFHVILWQPLFNLLILLCYYLPGHNLGVAIITLTLLIRIILYPLQDKASKSQLAMQALQPKLKEIQAKYKNNKEEQAKAMMGLYKTEKINPFSAFFVTLVQLPILFILYRMFWQGIQEESFVYLYSFVQRPEVINPMFLGINLNEPSPILAVIAGITFFLQSKFAMPKKDKSEEQSSKKPGFADMFQKQMLFLFPILITVILFRLPSALGLYLLVAGIFMAGQQFFIRKKYYLTKK